MVKRSQNPHHTRSSQGAQPIENDHSVKAFLGVGEDLHFTENVPRLTTQYIFSTLVFIEIFPLQRYNSINTLIHKKQI